MNYFSQRDVRYGLDWKGGAYGRGHLQSILPDSDGIRNPLYALDVATRARAPVWLQKVQRVATRRAENVTCTSIETPERPRSSGNCEPFQSDRRTRAFRIWADQGGTRACPRY